MQIFHTGFPQHHLCVCIHFLNGLTFFLTRFPTQTSALQAAANFTLFLNIFVFHSTLQKSSLIQRSPRISTIKTAFYFLPYESFEHLIHFLSQIPSVSKPWWRHRGVMSAERPSRPPEPEINQHFSNHTPQPADWLWHIKSILRPRMNRRL